MSRILGVDPGSVSAAYALLDGPRLETCGDLPVIDRMVDARALSSIVKSLNPDAAIIEQVSAWPGQGVSSAFKFGMGAGIIRGVLTAHDVPVLLVTATKWKRFFALGSDAEKSRALAQRLYPSADLRRKRDHNKAEAILIAHWCHKTSYF